MSITNNNNMGKGKIEWQIEKIGQELLAFLYERYKTCTDENSSIYFDLSNTFERFEGVELVATTNYPTLSFYVYLNYGSAGITYNNPKDPNIRFYISVENSEDFGITEEKLNKKPIRITKITEKLEYWEPKKSR